ncbi:hypothetical protein FDP41_004401 [Naegleria fowleri]|uniref:Uncharacterized protein n=1 Tax=Naegleria fowleri TaxID=5763 RepID=A0A6A5BNT6_NAEFO|nr:uncharacterized protein FDP41_004401 [Naegleria fowleri]KAF0976502.1 hypothetical protein FDP41_004401 [Naegleria fowleri]CAG4712826.1 unnamed protein product [Naegleria fowleri]
MASSSSNNNNTIAVPMASQMDTYSSGDDNDEYSRTKHIPSRLMLKKNLNNNNNMNHALSSSMINNPIQQQHEEQLMESEECFALPYFETENPLKNRIGQITMSDISPRGHEVSPVDTKKMERRRSLQLKIKKPTSVALGHPEVAIMSNVNNSATLSSQHQLTTKNSYDSVVDLSESAQSQKIKPPLQIAAIPKLNLGKVENFKDDDYTSSGSTNEDTSSLSDRDSVTEASSVLSKNHSTDASSTSIMTNSTLTPKVDNSNNGTSHQKIHPINNSSSTTSVIRKYKRPHTSRESRSELQYIVASSNAEFGGETKSKQIAKLLLSQNKGCGTQQTTSTTPEQNGNVVTSSIPSSTSTNTTTRPNVFNSGNNSPSKVQIQRNLKRHSVAREFHNLQEYLQSRIKEQQQLMSPPSPTFKPQQHDFSKPPSIATPRSSALESKLLTMANNLKRTSQVLELNEQLLKEEKRKSAQAWTLLSTLEDDHSMSQLKYEELKFHYEVKCEELKYAKKHMEEMEAQIKKLEGNYNFLDQEKIRLQREVQELKRALEMKEQEGQQRCCCIM